GVSEPFAASVVSAPVTSAAWNTRSMVNRPANASAVANWVPLRRARPYLRPSTKGASPGAPERGMSRHGLAGEPRFADAEHRRREMGEWSEVARRSHRRLARDDRDDAASQD